MTPSYPVGLIWLRRDLRLADNAAIYHAARHCAKLYCVFVFDDSILAQLPQHIAPLHAMALRTYRAWTDQLERPVSVPVSVPASRPDPVSASQFTTAGTLNRFHLKSNAYLRMQL